MFQTTNQVFFKAILLVKWSGFLSRAKKLKNHTAAARNVLAAMPRKKLRYKPFYTQ